MTQYFKCYIFVGHEKGHRKGHTQFTREISKAKKEAMSFDFNIEIVTKSQPIGQFRNFRKCHHPMFSNKFYTISL